jgi:site-specific recombinase XerC
MLLRVTGERRDGFRDHVLFSLALGTGLREHEIVALDAGQVMESGEVRRRILLATFKGSDRLKDTFQEVVLPDLLRHKLAKFIKWKQAEGEATDPISPLFVSRVGKRISTRQLRHLFHLWQDRAGFERRLPFHALRHTACSAIYRNTKDIRLTQRFARHASVVTTSIYAHPTDENLVRAVRDLAC